VSNKDLVRRLRRYYGIGIRTIDGDLRFDAAEKIENLMAERVRGWIGVQMSFDEKPGYHPPALSFILAGLLWAIIVMILIIIMRATDAL
jgi:hypothetical protein